MASLDRAEEAFRATLANDLDISGALGAVFGLVKDVNRMLASGEVNTMDAQVIDDKLMTWDRVLGVLQPETGPEVDAVRIEDLIRQRNEARAASDNIGFSHVESSVVSR